MSTAKQHDDIDTDVLAVVGQAINLIHPNKKRSHISTFDLVNVCEIFGNVLFKLPDDGSKPPQTKKQRTIPSQEPEPIVPDEPPSQPDPIQDPKPKTTKKRKPQTQPQQRKAPITRKFGFSIHPCGFMSASSHYKGKHIKSGMCVFDNKLRQFPFCICGFSVQKHVNQWKKQISDNGLAYLSSSMANHMRSCTIFADEYARFLKDIQGFSSNPHETIRIYGIDFGTSNLAEPYKSVAEATKVGPVSITCVGCWTVFDNDMDLYLHTFKCEDFGQIIPSFAQEIMNFVYRKYALMNAVDYGDYLTDPSFKHHLFYDDTTKKNVLVPFPSQPQEPDAELGEDVNEEQDLTPKPSQEAVKRQTDQKKTTTTKQPKSDTTNNDAKKKTIILDELISYPNPPITRITKRTKQTSFSQPPKQQSKYSLEDDPITD